VEVVDGSEPDLEENEYDDEDEEVEKSRRPLADRKAAARAAKAKSGIYAAQAPAIEGRFKRWEKAYDANRQAKLARGEKSVFDSGEAANRFAALFRLQWAKAINKNDYANRANDLEIVGKSTATTINNAAHGNFIAVEEFRPELIDLLNESGATRQLLNVIPSDGTPISLPRHLADFQVAWEGEPASGNSTLANTDRIKLIPKQLMGVAKITNAMLNDSRIGLPDYYAMQGARQMGFAEDLAFFNGDGTSGFGGIVGLRNFLDTTAILDASGANWGAVTDADIARLQGAVLSKAITQGNARFSCTTGAYFGTFNRINRGLGGTDFAGGRSAGLAESTHGYPVVFNNVTQASSASGQVFAYFGDFDMAAKMIEVSGSYEFAVSDQERFSTDETVFRVKERIDILVHDGGSSTTQSPVVAIKTT
jgi:HK97 family phage major capsid protein